MDLAKLYATQISLSEWFEKIGHKKTRAFRHADNEKREYLRILREETGLPYDAATIFPATALVEKSPELKSYVSAHASQACALRLVPKNPKLPKLRMRGKTVTGALAWFAEQKIDPTQYRAEFIPHADHYHWSTIFVVQEKGIFGEIIKGGHYQLTQGFHVDGTPMVFSYDFSKWDIAPKNASALRHIHSIVAHLRISRAKKQKQIQKRIRGASFVHNYLKGYFETVSSRDFGLWFIDYNQMLGKVPIPGMSNPHRDQAGSSLRGVPTSPGIVRGRVGKEILVCKMTTPAHVPLMMKSKGIITELGGILSHAAIVSRELKKPCIVAVPHAIKKLKKGAMIEMNGMTGIIKHVTNR